MRNFERNRNKSGIWESKPVLFILGIVILALAWSVARFWVKLGQTRQNRAIVEARAEALREQQATLAADIEKLETDRGKEEIFRENYGLAKIGEDLIVIVEDETPPLAPPKSIWQRFKYFLGNWLK